MQPTCLAGAILRASGISMLSCFSMLLLTSRTRLMARRWAAYPLTLVTSPQMMEDCCLLPADHHPWRYSRAAIPTHLPPSARWPGSMRWVERAGGAAPAAIL